MIRLDGVSVPQTDRSYLGYSAYDHQAAAEDLLTGSDEFFAINASPTGSGKTYSWLKPAMETGIDTIAVFPTNALVTDQVEAANELKQSHFGDDVGVIKVTSETVAAWREELGRGSPLSKGKALRQRVARSLDRNRVTILCTNPDTLTLVRRNLYNHYRLKQQFDRFEMLVVDEFHVADVKQRETLLFLIDELYSIPSRYAKTDKFYFLSATMNEGKTKRPLRRRIEDDIGATPSVLTADSKSDSRVSGDGGDWRRVMPQVALNLRVAPTFRTADELLSDGTFEEFVSFCGGGQTVVMLDGVHEVDRVYEALKERIDGRVRRITGFNRGDVRGKIDQFDVLVSNSAVEVGLNFQPERLVFSAHNAGTLVQRLGRLRDRGDDSSYRAWCYLPESVHARLQTELQSTDEPVPRSKFEKTAIETFENRCDYSSYSWRWADLEAYHHLKDRVDNTPSDEADAVFNDGIERIRRHFYEPYDCSFEKSDLERLESGLDCDLLDRLQPYRGDGLQVMVRDHEAEEMKLYDLFHILRWGQVRFRSRRSFREQLDTDEREFYDGYGSYAVGFCEYYGKFDTDQADEEEYAGRSVRLHDAGGRLHDSKQKPDSQRDPIVTDGLDVDVDSNNAPEPDGLSYLSDEMIECERLCYVLPGNPKYNQTEYDFDDFFFVYALDDASITLGTTALYAHCLVQDRVEAESKGRDWGWD
jgi:CRISPR-associated endonuclease/helicase Cas3